MESMIKKIIIGIQQNPKKLIIDTFLSYATLWTLLEPAVSFLSSTLLSNLTGLWKYLVFVIFAILIGIIRVFPKKEIVISLKNTNTKVRVVFADMFTLEGCKVISVNEYFDSEIGQPVSLNSLHGVFLKKILGGHTKPFDDAVLEQCQRFSLGNFPREEGKAIKYEIGTTVEVIHNDTQYFLFALCKTDEDYKAYSSPAMMLMALNGLWNTARAKHNGNPIVIPLVGSKLGGVGLPEEQLIELIIISILKTTKEQELSTDITISLHPGMIEEINLIEIKKKWS